MSDPIHEAIVELVWKARELDDPNAVVDDLYALVRSSAPAPDQQWFVRIDKHEGRGTTIEEAINTALERFHGCAYRLTGIRPKDRDHHHTIQVEQP